MIAIIGLGFVGLTTGLGLAHRIGAAVYGYEADGLKREQLKEKRVPFHEPHLQDYLGRYLDRRFFLCDSLAEAVHQARYIFLCVGTPAGPEGEVDLTDLCEAVRQCTAELDRQTARIVVIKSTVPPSTTTEVIKPMLEAAGLTPGETVGLASNPEFLREGAAWSDFIQPDRIVIGAADTMSGPLLQQLYEPFGVPVHVVSAQTAEFVKYLSNSMLASFISFANEMAMLAGHIGDVDTAKAFRLVHEDKRWSGEPARMTDYLFPGCGFGGYCLPKDNRALLHTASAKGYEASLLREVLSVNAKVKRHIVAQISRAAAADAAIGVLGLAFKPGSDDVRGTVSRDIIELLLEQGYSRITAYDPIASGAFRTAYPLPIAYAESLEELVENSGVVVILTAWPEFREKQELYKGKPVIDGRYVLETG
ncbi:UDP-glucose dehydrogenase family protein [Paenibacillus sp. y28]|uniref:UDP-glucose dehydrogenase family protein n=1 Tax=Paenibacillus sp. y28 TaxID=3129110 RepID=UPI0030182196